jgi:nucleoside-diphosphate-sugar epimerase
MTVLVTGGAGYVGFNVVEDLLANGREVVLFDRGAVPPSAQRTVAPYAKQLTVVQADICDADQLTRAFEQHKVDGVIHCAAVTSGAEREARDPKSVVDVNLNGTINVLDAARRTQGETRRVFEFRFGLRRNAGKASAAFRRYFAPIPIGLYSITKQAARNARACGCASFGISMWCLPGSAM